MKRNEFLKKGLLAGTGLGLVSVLNASPSLDITLKRVCIYDNYIRGLSHYLKEVNAIDWKAPLETSIVRESNNKFDNFAVAIYVQQRKIGYIAAYENISIAKMLDAGVEIIPIVELDNSIDMEQIPFFKPHIYIQLYTELIVPNNKITLLSNNELRSDDSLDKYRQGMGFESDDNS